MTDYTSPVTRLTSVVVGSVALAGCGKYQEENWYLLAAEVSCETSRRCDTANFWYHYDSLAACVDDSLGSAEAPAEGCVYDKKAARKCVDAMKWSCRKIGERYDELQDVCDSVWTCEGIPIDSGGIEPL